ncbi:zinc finger protein [Holotrichia oblita]|uniref:Zinc finger protein n=1 Tax=Holotrichia oblita TaxID=644536 RepID=A0ACB9TXP1_HOLOL|nr:zinc finger protein [Holotrichia oblita]
MMWKHVSVHEDKYTCEICSEVQESAYKYSVHLIEHIGDNKYTCPLCSYVTRRKSSIALHINSIHLKRYPYYCKHCGKGYHDAVTYTAHEQMHVGDHSVTCIVCQRSFAYTRNLIHHQIRYHKVTTIDVQVKNQCEICKKYYTSPVTLRRHKQVHEINVSDARPNLCEWCGKHFKDSATLKHHERIHTGYKPHKCSYCEKVFSRKAYLVLHERTHSGEKPYCCDHCGKRFNQPTTLKIHVRSHTGERPYSCHLTAAVDFIPITSIKKKYKKRKRGPPWFCEKCQKLFKNRAALYDHKREAHIQLPKDHLSSYTYNEDTERFTCKICKIEMKLKERMVSHVLTHEEKFTCKICDAIIYSAYKYSVHVQKHNKDDGYQCPFCVYSSTRPSGIFVHINRMHLGRFAYMCKHCGKGFDDVVMHREHEASHEKSQSVSCIVCKKEFAFTRSRGRSRKTKQKGCIWSCKQCDLKFETRRYLTEHRRKSHKKTTHMHTFKDNVIYKYLFNKTTNLYSCKTCDHETKDKDEIKEHVLTHEEKFECTMCKETFYDAYKYCLHVKKHDEIDRDYKCPLCNYATPRRTSISQHINMTHLKKYLYNCQFCGKGFCDVMIYKEHENMHLGGGEPIRCVVCQKTYSFTRNLIQHQIKIHKVPILGVLAKNQCRVCKRIYSKTSTLENHMKIHDRSVPKPKTHLCDTCGKGFAQRSKLVLHHRVHTGYKPHKCSYCSKCFTQREYLVMHERVHSGEKPYCCVYCGKCFNQEAPLRIHVRTHTGEKPYVCRLCSRAFVSNASLKLHLTKCAG